MRMHRLPQGRVTPGDRPQCEACAAVAAADANPDKSESNHSHKGNGTERDHSQGHRADTLEQQHGGDREERQATYMPGPGPLNKALRRSHYQMPTEEEILPELAKA